MNSSSKQFEVYKKSTENQDTIWAYFLREKNGYSAQCKKCQKEIKCSGGSTSSLHKHLKAIHDTSILKRKLNSSEIVPKPPKKIYDYFGSKFDDSLPAILSRMTARDGLPFSVFCTSVDLRRLLLAKGFHESDIPKSPNTIRNIVLNYSDKICEQLKQEFLTKKKNGNRFSLSLDEWTSIRNRRYLNVNVHSEKEFWNLGLVRIHGSLPAEKCIEILTQKLNEFGLCLNSDIVCIVTDGSSVMQKVGRLLKADQQLCLAHGIQLAVISVLYGLFRAKVSVEIEDIVENNELSEEDSESEDVFYDFASSHNHSFVVTTNFDSQTDVALSYNDLEVVIRKVRAIVKLFRFSPTKNDILQKYVTTEFGKELMLILDSRTRWNSLLTMLERFFEIKSCIQKALIDLNTSYAFSESEFKLLSETIASLLPIKLTVEALCRKDANLLTASAAINFMIMSLEKMNNNLANELRVSLEFRIKQRYNDLFTVIHYLHKRCGVIGDTESVANGLFPTLKKAAITKTIISLLERLKNAPDDDNDTNLSTKYECNDDDLVLTKTEEEPSVPSTTSTKTMQDMMQKAIERHLESITVPAEQIKSNLAKTVKREMAQFEEDGVRGDKLKLCYNHLLTIPPTSVEAERAFSASGKICTKIRSRLCDKSINHLCFLRAFFEKNI